MITVRPAVEADRERWQAFLATARSGDFLHDWGWAAVAEHDGQPQRRFVAVEDDLLVAIAAAQVRALPLGRSFWYVPHGPVLDYADPAAGERLRAVAIGLREAARRDGAIAIKLEPRLPRDDAATALFGRWRHDPRTLQVGWTRLVELADDDDLMSRFDKDTRYAIRRSEREGVTVTSHADANDRHPIDGLHDLVLETQRRAGFPRPPLERYRAAWAGLAAEGRAAIFEARHEQRLLASAMLAIEGDRSFYLFAGSLREEKGETKRYASYALQWALMRHARERGARVHDLWGIAPEGAGPEHAWYGVGLFKKGFDGEPVTWAGSWDVIVDPAMYRLRSTVEAWRGGLSGILRRTRGLLPG